MYNPQRARAGGVLFSDLLQRVAEAAPEMRIRFTSPHPKDCGDDVLQARHCGIGPESVLRGLACDVSACNLPYMC